LESRGFVPHYGWKEGNARGPLPFCTNVDCSAVVFEKQPPTRRQGGYREEEKGGQGETETSASTADIMAKEKTSDETQGKATADGIIEREMKTMFKDLNRAWPTRNMYLYHITKYQQQSKDASDMQPESSCLYTS
jgi:hypothetical protein